MRDEKLATLPEKQWSQRGFKSIVNAHLCRWAFCSVMKRKLWQIKSWNTNGIKVEGNDLVIYFEGDCELILANVIQPSGMFENSTLAAVATWFNLIATLPLCQFTCQHLLLLACSLSLETVVMPELQVDPPGRALSSFFVPRRSSRGRLVGRNAVGRRRTDWAQLLARLPIQDSPPPFLLLASCFFMNMCIPVPMCMMMHTCANTNTHSVSHAFLYCPFFWQANKDPLFLTGVTFPSEYPASPETLVKLTVYDAKDKSQESVSK